jgi:hypothetical protein
MFNGGFSQVFKVYMLQVVHVLQEGSPNGVVHVLQVVHVLRPFCWLVLVVWKPELLSNEIPTYEDSKPQHRQRSGVRGEVQDRRPWMKPGQLQSTVRRTAIEPVEGAGPRWSTDQWQHTQNRSGDGSVTLISRPRVT